MLSVNYQTIIYNYQCIDKKCNCFSFMNLLCSFFNIRYFKSNNFWRNSYYSGCIMTMFLLRKFLLVAPNGHLRHVWHWSSCSDHVGCGHCSEKLVKPTGNNDKTKEIPCILVTSQLRPVRLQWYYSEMVHWSGGMTFDNHNWVLKLWSSRSIHQPVHTAISLYEKEYFNLFNRSF